MNAVAPNGAEGFLARYAATKGNLPGDSTLRAAAADAFRTLGLPGAERGRRVEAWKYTSLQPLAGMSFRSGGEFSSMPLADDANRIVVTNGQVSTSVPGMTRLKVTQPGQFRIVDREAAALRRPGPCRGGLITFRPERFDPNDPI